METRKEFLVKIYHPERLSWEDGLLDGMVNKNHIMYVAQHQLDSRKSPATSVNAGYDIYEEEYEKAGDFWKLVKVTKLNP